MKLDLDDSIIFNYHSASQRARIMTEGWMSENMYCPRCGNLHIEHFENNRPVADFFCPVCKNQYELKSKNGRLGRKVNDGAYEKMLERITSNQNPDFLFMSYSKSELKVNDLIIVPKYFFVPDIIEKRNPLNSSAHRFGWTGCNILIYKVPEQGRISVVSNGKIADKMSVVDKINRSEKLKIQDVKARGWLFDVLNCVNKLSKNIFTLNEIYGFEDELFIKHSQNNNIRAKIRQQLQFLRDRGFIEFLGDGKYKKTAT